MDTLEYLTADQVTESKIITAPLSRSASGYGPKIPTQYMVKVDNKWRRVYVMVWSNLGSSYVIIKGVDTFLHSDVEHDLQALTA